MDRLAGGVKGRHTSQAMPVCAGTLRAPLPVPPAPARKPHLSCRHSSVVATCRNDRTLLIGQATSRTPERSLKRPYRRRLDAEGRLPTSSTWERRLARLGSGVRAASAGTGSSSSSMTRVGSRAVEPQSNLWVASSSCVVELVSARAWPDPAGPRAPARRPFANGMLDERAVRLPPPPARSLAVCRSAHSRHTGQCRAAWVTELLNPRSSPGRPLWAGTRSSGRRCSRAIPWPVDGRARGR